MVLKQKCQCVSYVAQMDAYHLNMVNKMQVTNITSYRTKLCCKDLLGMWG